MKLFLIALILVFSLALAFSSAHGAPVATVVNGPVSLRGVALCKFEDDGMTLIVSDAGKDVTKHYFCSSYGKALALLVTDSRGKSYVFLRYGEGRGTNAVEEYLIVFSLARELVEYVRTPLSAGAGPTSRWSYDYRVEKPASGGIRLVLTLRVEGDDVLVAPKEKTRIIDVGRDDP